MIKNGTKTVLRSLRAPLKATKETPRANWGRIFGKGCFHIVNVACAIHLCSEYVGRVSLMEGPSMLPTLADKGEIVLEDRLTPRLFPERIARGDLVVLKSPIMPGRIVCKRVLGLPGDIICVDPTGETAPSTEHIVIPKGHIWISGDNATYSRDSRHYGPVSMSLIESKLFLRFFPFTIFSNKVEYID